jgi:acyl phosphate:glycerol-3-phosphate acyltransferase
MRMLLILAGYLIGGIPFAVPVVRLLHGLDVRDTGSGNVGARNSLRVGGPLAGLLVLVLDALKAALPMLLARSWAGDAWTVALAGVAAVAGHCFSPYLILRARNQRWAGWRKFLLLAGGQGLASALGVILMAAPALALPVLALGALFIFLKRPTAAAVAMIAVGPLVAALLGYPAPNVAALGLSAGVIAIKLLPDLLPLPAPVSQAHE